MMQQAVMAAVVCVFGVGVAACEILRVVIYGLRMMLVFWKSTSTKHYKAQTVIVDGECTLCNLLRTFVLFRHASPPAIHLKFLPAQRVIKALGGAEDTEARQVADVVATAYRSADAAAENLLARLHGVKEGEVVVGADVVLGLLRECHAPYPWVAATAERLPRALVGRVYDVVAANRHAWFGRGAGRRGVETVDDAAQSWQVVQEATAVGAALVAALTMAVLPLGDGHKDGPTQRATRVACAAVLALLVWREALQSKTSSSSFSRGLFDRYVGYASPASLALMRATCALILAVFTLPFMTTPLAKTAEVPRFMCKPTGVLRLLGEVAPSLFGKDALLASASRLSGLETTTRALLAAVFFGVGTSLTAPLAAAAWLVYGGVLRSYNTWRGHSFIAAWWTLVVIACRGGASDVWSVDASCRGKRQQQQRSSTKREAAYRGWTRFMATLVFANNYFMAGLSKLCASGVAWAAGINLKAKLLQTSLTQGSFGVYLSLFLRRWPLPFWLFLGICGLYGELLMGLVPFRAPAKLFFPALMWGMHVGIVFLQHIVFVDLLTMIPAWYLWHYLDLLEEDNDLYVGGPWDWRRVVRDARDALGLPALAPKDDKDHRQDLLEKQSDEAPEDHQFVENDVDAVARSGFARSVLLMGIFVAVWARGAEWYPWNSFRMFADWTPNPIDYERYVALDAQRNHLRNFHMHEINPVLNRKRFVDALDVCARSPQSRDCRAFLSFMDPRAKALPESPAFLVVQNRAWDFVRHIDNPDYCDEMTTYEYDVGASTVLKKKHQPCDPIDWHLCCTSSIGTI